MSREYYIGIDHGTTSSQVASTWMDQPVVLLPPGVYGIPSVFYYDRQTGIQVGQDALDAGIGTAAQNLVIEPKMSLGQNYLIDGQKFTSREIITEIDRKVISTGKRIAENRNIGDTIGGVVMTVPARFGMQERNELMKAAYEALDGQVNVNVTNEPTAAAIAYFHDTLEDGKKVCVLDLGGGTCDAAIVIADHASMERFLVVDSDMLPLGGRQWDQRLYEYFVTEMEKQKFKIRGDAALEEKVRRSARKAKEALSEPEKLQVTSRIEIKGRIVPMTITREKFEEMTEDLLTEAVGLLKVIYERNGADPDADIILVGGSCNMPQVKNRVEKEFPDNRVHLYMPEHAVVAGAAIYAEMLKDTTASGDLVQDRSPFSYGIECYSNYEKNEKMIRNIVIAGTQFPAEEESEFHTSYADQRVVVFDVYESQCQDQTYPVNGPQKRRVGSVTLRIPEYMPRGTPLPCRLKLNAQGIMEVRAEGPDHNHVEAVFHINESM